MKNTGVGTHNTGGKKTATQKGVTHKGQGKPASQNAKGMGKGPGATKE